MTTKTTSAAAGSPPFSGALQRALYRQTLAATGGAGIVLVAANVFSTTVGTLGLVSALISVAIYVTVGAVTLSRILSFHPHGVFGWPNIVTLSRTVLAALIAGYTAEISLWVLSPSAHLAWSFALLAGLAVALDGLDGWLARRIGPRSDFGARFDMESDALLVLILSVLAFVLGKAGIWVLLIGGLRYLFVAASYVWTFIDRPLPVSMRRKTICVVQGVTLSALAAPVVGGAFAATMAAIVLVLTVYSFAVDLVWLHRHRAGVSDERAGA